MPTTVQPESKSTSRRAVLAAAAGAAAAFAARAIASPTKVEGADTGPINIGGTYGDVQAQTTLGNQANDGIVLWIASNNDLGHGNGTAIVGYSANGIGVQGQNGDSGPGVRGISAYGYGVHGSGSTGVYGSGGIDAGVHGTSSSGYGVHGESSSGWGVYGTSSSAAGVYGVSTTHIGVAGVSSAGDKPANLGFSTGFGGDGTGVQGVSGATLPAARPKTGVYGYAAQDSSARGVIGETTSGHGVHGIATSGYAGYFVGKVYTAKFHELKEITTPSAPGANKGRLFMRDNGSGKTQLCVRFNTGGVLVIKTQP